MKTFQLSTYVWWRAQGIYAVLNLLLALLVPVWDAVSSGHQLYGDDFAGLAVLSIGFAMMCGVPAWLVMGGLMTALAKPLARRGWFRRAILVTGLLATKAALYTGFGVVLGDMVGGADDPFILLFSILAYIAMMLSVFSMRHTIARHADALSRPDTAQHPATIVQP